MNRNLVAFLVLLNILAHVLGISPRVPNVGAQVHSDTAAPSITIVSPENETYAADAVPLTFALTLALSSSLWIGYSMDGKANVTITGNTTLSDLSTGPHCIIIYAIDAAGYTVASETIYFTIETAQPSLVSFPFEWIAVAIAAVIAVAGIIVLVLYRKRGRFAGAEASHGKN